MEQKKFKIGPPPPVMPTVMQASLPGMEKVIVGLDHAPATFDVRGNVLGPGGANLQYISNETGAVVTLRGRTSGYPEPGLGQESPEPLHIFVEHHKIEVLQAARQLAFNLVETIQQEFAQLHSQLPAPGAPLQLPPAVGLPPDQLPPRVVQLPVPGQVGGIVSVPPPQLVQQPPPLRTVNLPRPGVHIPAHQGPWSQVDQVLLQTPYIMDGLRRCSNSRALRLEKPGRELVTFLIVCNVAMWITETFEIKSQSISKDYRSQFYGRVLWTMLSHMALPLTMFYHFHSSVCLVDIGKSL